MAKRKRKAPKRKVPKRRRRRRRFGTLAFSLPGKVAKKQFIGVLRDIATIKGGETKKNVIKALDSLKNMANGLKTLTFDKKPEVTALYNGLIVSLMGGIEQDLTEGSDGSLKNTTAGMNNAKTYFVSLKDQMKDKKALKTNFKGYYDTIKAKIIEKMAGKDTTSLKPIRDILDNDVAKTVKLKSTILKTLPTSLLLFMIEEKSEEATNQALGNFTVDEAAKITEAAKKAAAEAAKKKAPASTEKPATPATKKEEQKKETSKEDPKKIPASTFGKRKRGPSASLKRMCKKNGVRLMVKRGKTRVYKSSKVLKEQCQRKLKKNKKKNFGRKKIKRSGIMPPRKRKTRGKKRRKQKGGAAKLAQILKASAKRQAKRARRRGRSAARYARQNPGRIAGGLAGASALGLAGYEGYLAARRGLRTSGADTRFQSPTGRLIGRGRRGARAGLQTAGTYLYNAPGRVRGYDYKGAPGRAYEGVRGYDYKGAPGRARKAGSGLLDRLFPGRVTRRTKKKVDAQRRAFDDASGTLPGDNFGSPFMYGKRRRRRRKKRSFGKKAKKPSAALKRMCKKHKVRLTLKRGGKRVYKSEAMLKKQCKKAMKRRKKK